MGSITSLPITTREFNLRDFYAQPPVEPTFAMIGNSLCSPDVSFFAANVADRNVTSRAVGHWLGAFSMQQIQIKAAYGIGGAVAKTILDTHLTELVATKPGFAVGILFENDVGQNTSLETIAVQVERFITTCQGAGIVPVLVSPLPSVHFTDKTALWVGIAELCRRMCGQYGAPFVDGYLLYGDVASAFPNPRAGFTSDGIHPTTLGAMTIAEGVWSAIRPHVRVAQPMFGYQFGQPSNLVGNIRMTGTNGNKFNGFTGSVPSNYGVGGTVTTLASAVASIVDSGATRKVNLVVSHTDRAQLFLQTPGVAIASLGAAVGDVVECFLDVDINSLTNAEVVGSLEAVPIGSTPRPRVGSSSSTWAENNGTIANKTVRLKSPQFAIPVGTTSLYFTTRFGGHVAFAADINFYNPVIRKVS